MSTPLKTDTTLLDFISNIPSGKASDMRLMMYDTEPTPMGMIKGPLSFDIGYREFAPFGGYKGEEGGGLVYEIFRQEDIMGHLMRQKKLSHATADEYYYVAQYLAKDTDVGSSTKGWFSTKLDSAPNYGRLTRQTFLNEIYGHLDELTGSGDSSSFSMVDDAEVQRKYISMTEHLQVQRESIEHFARMNSKNSTTQKREFNALRRVETMNSLLMLYSEFMKGTVDNNNAIRRLKQLNEGMHDVVHSFRERQFKEAILRMKKGEDLNYLEDAQYLKSIPGGENIKPIAEIMKDYEKRFGDVVGIMGHNIDSDLRWTTNTLNAFGASQYAYLFDEEQINAYCSQRFTQRLYSLEGDELLQTMFKLNGGEIYKQLKARVDSDTLPSTTGQGYSFSLQSLHDSVIKSDKAQKHTALADVDWTIDVVQKIAEGIVEGELKELNKK